MADVADQAAERLETILEAGLAHRVDTSNRPMADGECHCCGDCVEGARIFCDAVCARKWNHEQERLKRNGR
jgi:hypothetical protein